MRKTLTRLLVAALAASSLISLSGAPSGADDAGELLVDLSVDIVSKPATVSPEGAPAVFEVTVTNSGLIGTTAATLTVDLAAGTSYLAGVSSADCSGSGSADVVCAVGALSPGSSQRFDVVAATPISSTSDSFTITTAATISNVRALGVEGAEAIEEALLNATNNTDSVNTLVRTDPNKKSGFLAEGQSMTLALSDGRDFTVTVPNGVVGVIVKEIARSDQATSPRTCTNGLSLATCGNGFTVDFEPHPIFQALDPNNALIFNMGLGTSDPCRGYGGTCFPTMFTADNSAMTALHNAPYCQGAGPANAAPGNGDMVQRADGYYEMCVNDEVKDGGAEFRFDMRGRSIDPPAIPGLDDLRL